MTDNREQELDLLKIDLETLITGMTIGNSMLSSVEMECLKVLIRCKSVMNSETLKEPTGEWIPIKNKNGTEIAVRCSVCKGSPKGGYRTKFCPNCGIKMK